MYISGAAAPPPPLVGPWDFEIWRPNLNVAVDAIGPETDFTLETDGKMCTKNKWTLLQNPKFHLLDQSKIEKNIKWYKVFSILKCVLGVPDHTATLQKKNMSYEKA